MPTCKPRTRWHPVLFKKAGGQNMKACTGLDPAAYRPPLEVGRRLQVALRRQGCRACHEPGWGAGVDLARDARGAAGWAC